MLEFASKSAELGTFPASNFLPSPPFCLATISSTLEKVNLKCWVIRLRLWFCFPLLAAAVDVYFAFSANRFFCGSEILVSFLIP